MARSVNKVTLLGNVGKDPEIRSTPAASWSPTLLWPPATAKRTRRATGRTTPNGTTSRPSTAPPRSSEKYVKKGSKLYVEGKITTNSWEDKETEQKRYRTEIIVFDLMLLSGREDGAGAGAGGYSRPASSSSSSASFDQRPPAEGTTTPNPPKSPTTIYRSRGRD